MAGFNLSQVPAAELVDAAKNGSPMLLQAVGRVLGLGAAEREALGVGKVPWWLFLVAGFAAGAVAGARVQKKWPEHVPKVVSG